jgi:hypothetical protein
MLGAKKHVQEECYKGNFIGAHYGIKEDLSTYLSDDWRQFNKHLFQSGWRATPAKARYQQVSLVANYGREQKEFRKVTWCHAQMVAGRITSVKSLDNYSYHFGEILQHRRTVR